MINTQHSAGSNYSQSSSLDEDKESTRRDAERSALYQLEKAKVQLIKLIMNLIHKNNFILFSLKG